MSEHPLDSVLQAAGAHLAHVAGVAMAVDYGHPAGEYAAVRSGAAIYDAGDRGLIDVRGRDRAGWLHNLTTNAVKTLQTGQGHYAFVLSVKGRILFDLNLLVREDAFWLDIDRRFVAEALGHFERYTISEDVQCRDRSGEFARIGLLGPAAGEVVEALGAMEVEAMPALSSRTVPLAGRQRLMVRHDFAGVFGVELYVEAADAAACWKRLLEIGRPVGLRPVGWSAVNILRIEAGIPWCGRDIDDEVVPAETGQAGRAVSYTKGCYLGQEVVERMRSRGVVANRLVGLRFSGADVAPQAGLKAEEAEVGRVTSVCESPAVGGWIGLGYVRAGHAGAGTRLMVGGTGVAAEVCEVPFR
jgi:folate-binding protein YgfZ